MTSIYSSISTERERVTHFSEYKIITPYCNGILYALNMEITTKGTTTTKIPLMNLMTTIYFTNQLKRQLSTFQRSIQALFM